LATESRQLGAPARVESRLMAAYRGHMGLAARPTPVRWWAPLLTWGSAAAAIAALAALLANSGPPRPAVHRMRPAGTELAAAFVAEPDLTAETLYDSGDFIPLPNTPGLGPNDEVNLVRIEIPRSAMVALGFAVSAEQALERVEADVVLGPDGQARAVRFLDE
jgi:hypothetical protein